MAEEGEAAVVNAAPAGEENTHRFKKSQDVAFYMRQMQGPKQQYRALLDSMVLTEKGARFHLLDSNTDTSLLLLVSACKNDTVRLQVDELQPIKPRYRVQDVLVEEPQCEQLRVKRQTSECVALTWASGRHQVRVWHRPFQVELLCEEEVLVTFNRRGRLWMEPLQEPPSEIEEDNTLWRETFKHFVDVKANGPSSVGADLRLHGFSHVYGLPEHADGLRLRDTSRSEPYRLFNLDVFGYELRSGLGLYGSVPLLLAHRPDRSLGLFWINASETYVHLNYRGSDAQEEQVAVTGQRATHTDVHWLSESGVTDCVLLLGPGPRQLFSQYARLTGLPLLPPLFALGYHQSRWNYEDEADVRAVDEGFDRHRLPYDVLWLDIEHTHGKRYFTWDPERFPDPAGLQRHLQDKSRKMVVISDPHLKVDPDWPLYQEAIDGGHFVKDREGQVFVGSCWPGESCFLDFSSAATRAWYSRCYGHDKYKGSTPSLFLWNDMNEPSVFGGAEQTMPKDAVHHGGWEHRDLHNLYGFYQHMATADGLLSRCGGSERTFVLSRSFFAGSQRFGAVWTGDNVATWDYLKISIPMLLSLSVTGLPLCGADVGGFFKDPEPELLVRWYQAGALQPFFRGHSAIVSARREPWLFGDEVTARIRSVLQDRYRLLHYWYTLFHQAHTAALPPIRPLWVEFPEDQSLFSVENPYMIGGALLACPITDPGVEEVQVLLPGSDEIWFDVHSAQGHEGGQTLSLPVTMDTVPVYQRGGSVICRSTTSGSCSADLQLIPLGLTVALNCKGGATGDLYLDDGRSFDYRHRRAFSLRTFTMVSGRLLCRAGSEEGTFDSDLVVESITLLGLKEEPSAVTVHLSGSEEGAAAQFDFTQTCRKLTVTQLGLKVATDWDVLLL